MPRTASIGALMSYCCCCGGQAAALLYRTRLQCLLCQGSTAASRFWARFLPVICRPTPSVLRRVKDPSHAACMLSATPAQLRDHGTQLPMVIGPDYGAVWLCQTSAVLQLFARELRPGWVSWGNDCLHFQTLDRFTE